MKDIYIGFTPEDSPNVKEGVAIIVRDRVVEWYNPTSRAVGSPGVQGKLFGHVVCDFLHRKDILTHDKLNDVHPEVKETKQVLKKLIRDLYQKLSELKNPDLIIGNTEADLLSRLNNALKEFFDSEELIQTSSDLKSDKEGSHPTDEPPESKKGIFIENLLLNKIDSDGNIKALEDDDYLSSETEYQGILNIFNGLSQTFNLKLKIFSKKKVVNLSQDAMIIPNDNSLNFKFQIPEDILRGEFKIYSEIYDNKSNEFLDKKTFVRYIEPLVMDLKFLEKIFLLGGQYGVSYRVLRTKLSGTRMLDIKIYDSEENLIHEEGPTKIEKSSTDKPEIFYFIIDKLSPRGKYTLKLNLQNGPEIIQCERRLFVVHSYIKSVVVSKTNIKFNEKFDIKIILTNPCSEIIQEGILKIEIENRTYYYFEKRQDHINLEPDQKFEISFNDLFLDDSNEKGVYYINAYFSIPTDSKPEVKSISLILEGDTERKEGKGILKKFSFMQDEREGKDNKSLAVYSQGIIKVNTFHYLFRRIEDVDGIDLRAFKQFIVQVLWFAFKDEITKDGRFEEMWEFEKYMIEEKYLGE